jgi:SpoVK/Ycf46/Vps4 family AAA+-type ATPase
VSPDVNFEMLVKEIPESQTVTGADLYGVCSQAWLNAARRTIKLSQGTIFVISVESLSICFFFGVSQNLFNVFPFTFYVSERDSDKKVFVSHDDFVSAFSYFRKNS